MSPRERRRRKRHRSIGKRLTRILNRWTASHFYVSWKPDFQLLLQQLPGFSRLYDDWVKYNRNNNSGDLVRFYFLYLQVSYVQEAMIPGAFAEVGVFRGTTAKLFASTAPDREIYLFDTFEGCSEKDMDAERGFSEASPGGFETSVDELTQWLGDARYQLVKGYFPESTARVPADQRYALVHLDADLYAPQRAGLEYFYPRLNPGGVLIAHDCGNFFDGARQAVVEFFADKPESHVWIPDKSGSVAVIKCK